MKKIMIFFSVICAALCISLASCDDPETASTVVDAIGAGADGWSFVGYADSEYDCDAMSSEAGYSYHRFNTGSGSCYGR